MIALNLFCSILLVFFPFAFCPRPHFVIYCHIRKRPKRNTNKNENLLNHFGLTTFVRSCQLMPSRALSLDTFSSTNLCKGIKKVVRTKILTTFFIEYDIYSNILLNSSALTVLSSTVTASLMAEPSLISMQRSMRLSIVSRFLNISFTAFSRYSSGMFSMPY